jgi:hypothetical protein
MTEAEFIRCQNPRQMLEFLKGTGRGTGRKNRLFAVACCRPVFHLFTEEWSRKVVEVAKRHAEGLEDDKVLALARDATGVWRRTEAAGRRQPTLLSRTTAELASYVAGHDPWKAAADAAWTARWLGRKANAGASKDRLEVDQATLLRDLFGPLPFRPVTIPAAVLTWNSGCVVKLATSIYEEREMPSGALDAGRLIVLADALEEAGLEDQEVLGHLREQGAVHVRGFWVTDAILGKG